MSMIFKYSLPDISITVNNFTMPLLFFSNIPQCISWNQLSNSVLSLLQFMSFYFYTKKDLEFAPSFKKHFQKNRFHKTKGGVCGICQNHSSAFLNKPRFFGCSNSGGASLDILGSALPKISVFATGIRTPLFKPNSTIRQSYVVSTTFP